MKQASLNFRSTASQNQNSTSDEFKYLPSGGPLCSSKSERGCKRGMGDQVEGPVDKKRRK